MHTINSGESRSSYSHYSMTQVNDEKPVVHREHQEQVQSWGQPKSVGAIQSESNLTNRLASSSSSLCDRKLPIQSDQLGFNEQQSFSSQTRAIERPLMSRPVPSFSQQNLQQQSSSSSYSHLSQTTTRNTNQQQQHRLENQHFQSVPHFHGFQFQVLPGFQGKSDIHK